MNAGSILPGNARAHGQSEAQKRDDDDHGNVIPVLPDVHTRK